MNNKKIFFLSGLPRSGTTLFSNIIMQNPDIYSGGNSPVCQLMWDIQESCEIKCSEQLIATDRQDFKKELISSVPHQFYKNIDRSIIIDKCRAWTLKNNYQMIKDYITDDPKIIIFIRDIKEIVESFVKIGFIPNRIHEDRIFDHDSEPLMKYFYGVVSVKQNHSKNICVIDYNNFIKNTNEEMLKIYNFLEIDYFQHQYINIIDNSLENDIAYGIPNMHSIRNRVEKNNYIVKLNNSSIQKSKYLNSIIFN